MKAMAFEVGCGHCGGTLAPLAEGVATSTAVSAVVICRECNRQWLVRVTMESVRTSKAELNYRDKVRSGRRVAV